MFEDFRSTYKNRKTGTIHKVKRIDQNNYKIINVNGEPEDIVTRELRKNFEFISYKKALREYFFVPQVDG